MQSNNKDPIFRVDVMLEYKNRKTFFAKGYIPNWFEEVLQLKKLKCTVPWIYVIQDFDNQNILVTFYEKKVQKANQTEFRIEKKILKKVTNYMLSGKVFFFNG